MSLGSDDGLLVVGGELVHGVRSKMDSKCSATCTKPIYFGVAGKCERDAKTQKYFCKCPQGYSGKGDFFLWEDCRVNEQIQFMFHVLLTVVGCMCTILSLAGLVYLLLYWKYLKPEAETGRGSNTAYSRSNLSSNMTLHLAAPVSQAGSIDVDNSSVKGSVVEKDSDGDPPSRHKPESLNWKKRSPFGKELPVGIGIPPDTMRRAHKYTRKKRNREYFSIVTIGACTTYALFSAVYAIGYFIGDYRWEVNWVQDFSLVCMVSCLLIGMWCWFFIFYENLPSLRLYGKLFGVENILINRPKLVRRMIICRCIIIVLINAVFLFFLPMIYLKPNPTGEKEHNLSMQFYIALSWVLLFWTMDYTVFCFCVLQILRRLFGQLRSLRSEAGKSGISTGPDKNIFECALKIIIDAQIAVLVLGTFQCLLLTLNATVTAVRDTSFVTVNLCALCGNLVGIVMVYFTVFKLRGAKTPKGKRPTHSSTPSSMISTSES